MLRIEVPWVEGFDDDKEEFVPAEVYPLELEHSLVSLSKWESEFEKPFLSTAEKTPVETVGYIKAMILTPNVPEAVLAAISDDNVKEISAYINAKMTATTFNDGHNERSRAIITSELIYSWMVALQIPFECEKWHLTRLLNLIRVCNLKNQPAKKLSKGQEMARRQSLNAQRKAQLGTTG